MLYNNTAAVIFVINYQQRVHLISRCLWWALFWSLMNQGMPTSWYVFLV